MRRSRLPLILPATVLVALGSVAACTGDDDAEDSTDAAATGPTISITQPSAPLKVTVKQVHSGLRPREEAQLRTSAARPIGTWIAEGYLGEYPRDDFGSAFAGWTGDAAKLAQKDDQTTTNAALGSDVVAVVADEQRAALYVFAADKAAGGATADVTLRLTEQRTSGELVKVAVTGSVYLARTDAGWKIFGYDLSRKVLP